MARILIFFCLLFFKPASPAFAYGSVVCMPEEKNQLTASFTSAGDEFKENICPPKYFHSGKHDHGLVKKKKLKIRYMKSEVKLGLLYFEELYVPSFFTEGKLAFYYSSSLNTEYHKLYQLRGPPSFRYS